MTAQPRSHRKEVEAIQALCSQSDNLAEFSLEIGSRLAATLSAESFWFFLIDPPTGAPIHFECDRLGAELRVALCRNEIAAVGRRTGASPELGSGAEERQPRYSILKPGSDNVLVTVASQSGYDIDTVLLIGIGGLPRGLLVLLRPAGEPSLLKGHRRLLAEVTPAICRSLRRLLAAALTDSLPGSREVCLVMGSDGEIEATTPSVRWLWSTVERRVETLPFPALNLLGSLRRNLRDGSRPATVGATPLLQWTTGERYRVQGELLEGADDRARGLLQLRPMRTLDDTDSLLRLGLTHREAEVTQATLRGFTTRQAAYLLAVSKHTVEHHLSRVYEKLSLRTRSELAALLLGA